MLGTQRWLRRKVHSGFAQVAHSLVEEKEKGTQHCKRKEEEAGEGEGGDTAQTGTFRERQWYAHGTLRERQWSLHSADELTETWKPVGLPASRARSLVWSGCIF